MNFKAKIVFCLLVGLFMISSSGAQAAQLSLESSRFFGGQGEWYYTVGSLPATSSGAKVDVDVLKQKCDSSFQAITWSNGEESVDIVEATKGYLFVSKEPCNIDLENSDYSSGIDTSLARGWNIISVPATVEGFNFQNIQGSCSLRGDESSSGMEIFEISTRGTPVRTESNAQMKSGSAYWVEVENGCNIQLGSDSFLTPPDGETSETSESSSTTESTTTDSTTQTSAETFGDKCTGTGCPGETSETTSDPNYGSRELVWSEENIPQDMIEGKSYSLKYKVEDWGGKLDGVQIETKYKPSSNSNWQGSYSHTCGADSSQCYTSLSKNFFSPSQAGKYDVKTMITTEDGISSSKTWSVNVDPDMSVSFEINGDAPKEEESYYRSFEAQFIVRDNDGNLNNKQIALFKNDNPMYEFRECSGDSTVCKVPRYQKKTFGIYESGKFDVQEGKNDFTVYLKAKDGSTVHQDYVYYVNEVY